MTAARDARTHFLRGCMIDERGQLRRLFELAVTIAAAESLCCYIPTKARTTTASRYGGAIVESTEGRLFHPHRDLINCFCFYLEALDGVRICEKYSGLLAGTGERFAELAARVARASLADHRHWEAILEGHGLRVRGVCPGEMLTPADIGFMVGWWEFDEAMPPH